MKPIDGYEFWRFETAAFEVVALACEEDLNPADSFEFPEDIEFASQGGAHWFCAVIEVRVKHDGRIIGRDVLGGCSYHSYREFVSGHRDSDSNNRNTLAMKAKKTVLCHYFPSMVFEAIEDARNTLALEIAA